MGRKGGAKSKRETKEKNGSSSTLETTKILPVIAVNKHRKLSYHTLLPGHIWIIPNFLNSQECHNWIQWMEGHLLEHMSQRGTRYLAARECYRLQLHNTDIANQIYERLIKQVVNIQTKLLSEFGQAINCNPNIRFYKYTKNMSFGKHIDDSNDLENGYTRMTLLIYLSDCQGGATRFDKPNGSGDVAFAPQQGATLLHLHGDDCLLHQADPVLGGIKYVLRSDIVYQKS